MPKLAIVLLAALLATAAVAGAMPASANAAATVWAVGDGGVESLDDDALAASIESMGAFDRLLYLGDVYETGTAGEFATNYESGFGRFKQLTSPTPGNHEWGNRATGYDPYWGPLAPQTNGGHYYSYDLDGWHVVSLNSEENHASNSNQLAWLRQDLRGYPGTCTLAFIHAPRYSAGYHGDRAGLEPVWAQLTGHAVAFLAGHDHNYQRLRPERGVTQIIVGTGGRGFHSVDRTDPRLRAVDDARFGALRIRLRTGALGYRFITTDGVEGDSGSIDCVPHDPDAAGVQVLNPRSNRTYTQTLASFRGTRADEVDAPVRLSLVRRVGDSCRAFDGTRFVSASCRTRRSFPADGDSRWRFDLPEGVTLPRDSYKLTARVTEGQETIARLVRFSVR